MNTRKKRFINQKPRQPINEALFYVTITITEQLTAMSIPYSQRALVPGQTVEQIYKTINIWLRYNSGAITRDNPPIEIEAKYNADVQTFQIGPRDDLPKPMNIRLSGFSNDVMLYITIAQTISRMGDKGYIYWGLRLQDLYEELGVKIDETLLSELVPERMLKEIIAAKTRRIYIILIASIFISWFLWNSFRDLGVMYILVLMVPIIILAGWDLQAYRDLPGRLKKRHRTQ